MSAQLVELTVSVLSIIGLGVFCVWVMHLLGWDKT